LRPDEGQSTTFKLGGKEIQDHTDSKTVHLPGRPSMSTHKGSQRGGVPVMVTGGGHARRRCEAETFRKRIGGRLLCDLNFKESG